MQGVGHRDTELKGRHDDDDLAEAVLLVHQRARWDGEQLADHVHQRHVNADRLPAGAAWREGEGGSASTSERSTVSMDDGTVAQKRVV